MYEGTEKHGEWFVSQMAKNNAELAANPLGMSNPLRWTSLPLNRVRELVNVRYRRDDWRRELADNRTANEWLQRAYDLEVRERAAWSEGSQPEALALNKVKTYIRDMLDMYAPFGDADDECN